MVVPITDIVKMTLSVADILVEPIIGTPLVNFIKNFDPINIRRLWALKTMFCSG